MVRLPSANTCFLVSGGAPSSSLHYISEYPHVRPAYLTHCLTYIQALVDAQSHECKSVDARFYSYALGVQGLSYARIEVVLLPRRIGALLPCPMEISRRFIQRHLSLVAVYSRWSHITVTCASPSSRASFTSPLHLSGLSVDTVMCPQII
jgi:hypothetical protein